MIIYLVLFPLAFIIIFILIFIIFLNKKHKNFKVFIKKVDAKISKQREYVMISSLKRISIIAKSNDHVSQVLEELNVIFQNFLKKIHEIQILKNHLKKETKIKYIFFISQKVKSICDKIEFQYLLLDNIEKKFNSLSNDITAQDEILRTEFYFYQKNLRNIINYYMKKRIFFSFIANKIDDLNQSIKEIENNIEKIIDAGDNIQVSIFIQKYIKKIMLFSKIINYSPAIVTQIKMQIPQKVQKLNKLYMSYKKEIKLPVHLDYIHFQNDIQKISKQFIKAKNYFLELDIKESISKIKNVLKGLQMLENQINLEMKCKNAFIIYYQKIITEIKNTLNKCNLIKKQFKDIATSGKKINPELLNNYNNLKNDFDSLKNDANNFQTTIYDQKIPYSIKIQRIINLLELMKQTIFNINLFIDKVWEIDLVNVLIKNKFNRAESALHEIIALTKKENVFLLPEDKQKIQEALDEKHQIAKDIKLIINNKLKLSVDNFSVKVTKLYSIIFGKIQMAFHIRNIIKEFASRRALNPKLNLNLKIVENKYLEGDYVAGLNTAIACIEEINN